MNFYIHSHHVFGAEKAFLNCTIRKLAAGRSGAEKGWNKPKGKIADDFVFSHGKDNLLLVWKLSEADEVGLSTALPVDTTVEARRKPWLVYSLEVNTMNFCAFACCIDQESSTSETEDENGTSGKGNEGLLVAVPNILTSETVSCFLTFIGLQTSKTCENRGSRSIGRCFPTSHLQTSLYHTEGCQHQNWIGDGTFYF